ncbi:MAG: GDSL family lipase [Planctomycetaceae bacterium]|nr:GDSL family lipase [Planctomycetaceae bacterium]
MKLTRFASIAALLACPLLATHAAAQTAAAPAQAAKKPAAPPQKAGPKESVTPVPRDAKWMVRHNLINSRAVPGEVDVIFLGDSITQGWEGAGKEAWAKHFAPLKAMNAGIGGDRTEHVLWRLDNGNIKGITPKVAVIMIGTNNSRTNTSEQIADGIKAIVAKLREKLPETKILLLAIFPRGADNNDPLRKVNQGANDIVKSLDDGKTVFFLDIGPKFLTAEGVLEKSVMPDLLHLTPAAYETWAAAIEPKLHELLGK